MDYVNVPTKSPENMRHKTVYSHILCHKIGYNIYLPPTYTKCSKRYPVVYHIHGWQGNESSEIWATEKVCKNREAITVFMNAISSENEYFNALLQIESILTQELIPHIDTQYRTDTACKNRMLSGFSMGGAMAFYYAVKYPGLFGSVTAYAGTYHHQYHKGYDGVGKTPDAAAALYETIIREKRDLEQNNILCLVRQNAEKILENLHISIHIGTGDILFCDNEIMHLYLNTLNIPHDYKKFTGVGHDLAQIV